MNSLYKNYAFILHQKQSDFIDDCLYFDRKKSLEDRDYPNNERSEVIRKMINDKIKEKKH